MCSRIKLECETCNKRVNYNSGVTCSRCGSPFYCSEKCQLVDWEETHGKNCIDSINSLITSSILMKNGQLKQLNLNRDVIPRLVNRNVDPIYIKVIKMYNIPFFKINKGEIFVQSRENGIFLIVGDLNNNKQLEEAFDILTIKMKPVNSLKYTKLTFFMKIYFTLIYLDKAHDFAYKNSINLTPYYGSNVGFKISDDKRLKSIKNLPLDVEVIYNLRKLKNMAIKLVNNLSIVNFTKYMSNDVDKTGEPKYMKQVWNVWYKRFINKTKNDTIYVEKFPGTQKRAVNINAGNYINITMRAVIEPLKNLLDVKGLFLLLIHELSHTLAPSFTECSDCVTIYKDVYDKVTGSIKKTKKLLSIKPQDSHGPRFQSAMIFLYSEANRLGMIPFKRNTFEEYEMAMRKAHQDSSMLLTVDLKNV